MLRPLVRYVLGPNPERLFTVEPKIVFSYGNGEYRGYQKSQKIIQIKAIRIQT